MSDEFIKFPRVRGLEHICCLPRGTRRADEVVYGAKVKLHGTNGAVRVCNGLVTAQKRTSDVTIEDDNYDLAAWVASTADAWSARNADETVLIFGEWAGKGVQADSLDAIEQLQNRHFFIFGVLTNGLYLTEPDSISRYVPTIPHVHILPWLLTPGDERLSVQFSKGFSLSRLADYICEVVERVDIEDPYVLATFGISGPGEGIVAVPVNIDGVSDISWEQVRTLMFKAKSERHRVKKSDKAARSVLVAPDGIDSFVEQFVTEERCLQGVREACDGLVEKKRIKQFYRWVKEDVRQESGMEVEAMKADWYLVSKFVSKAAVAWYLRGCWKK